MANIIPNDREKLSSDWLVYPKPIPRASFRLFCFPYAGAGSMVYRTWPEGLPPQVEVVSLLFPGRESRLRTAPYVTMQPLVEALVEEILPTLDRPFAFYGHSLGGLIAFELARELRRRGHPLPTALFIASRRAPHLPDPHLPIAGLSREAFAQAIQQRYNGIPKIIQQDRDLMDLFIGILKADFSVLETYQYVQEPAFDFSITAYIGSQDTTIHLQDAAAWQVHSHRSIAVQTFPGDHFFLQSQRLALLAALSNALGQYIEGGE